MVPFDVVQYSLWSNQLCEPDKPRTVVVGYENVGDAPKEMCDTTSMKIDHKFLFVFDF
jgi:hypothetical protein